MTRKTYADLLIGGPYESNIDLQGLYAAFDAHLDDATAGMFQARNKLYIWDIDAITDPKILDFVADNMGLYGWDKTWNLATKKLKAKLGVELKRKAGTVYAIKKAPVYALDPAKFDEVNHPITVEERIGSQFYNGEYLYDGSITYNGGFHWTRFRMQVPYDGTPTAEELEAVADQVGHYKRLICNLTDVDGIVFVRLQSDFAHFRPEAGAYGTIPHDAALDITGDMTIAARLWWEGMSTHGNPLLVGKGESSVFGGNAELAAAIIDGAYFALEDNLATTDVVDSTGNFAGVASQNTNLMYNAAGIIGGCMDFSGGVADNFTCQFETVPGDTFAHDKAWFFSFWFYNPVTAGFKGVLGNAPSSGYPGFYCYLNGVSNLNIYIRQGASQYRIAYNSNLVAGWNHAIIGQDNSNSAAGTFVILNDTLTTLQSQTGGDLTNIATANPVYFGDNLIHGGFTERMDEIAFFPVAPTATMATALYNGGAGLGYGSAPVIPFGLRAPAGTDPITPELEWIVDNGSGVVGVTGPDLTANEMNTIVVRKSGLNIDFDVNGDTSGGGALANHGAATGGCLQIMRDIINTDSKTWGYLSDLVIYDYAITDDEREEYKAGYGPENVPAGYVGYWRMNEEGGLVCADEGGAMPDMTLVNTNWDQFLSPFGGDAVLAAKCIHYYTMSDDTTVSKSYRDAISPMGRMIGQWPCYSLRVDTDHLGYGMVVNESLSPLPYLSHYPDPIGDPDNDPITITQVSRTILIWIKDPNSSTNPLKSFFSQPSDMTDPEVSDGGVYMWSDANIVNVQYRLDASNFIIATSPTGYSYNVPQLIGFSFEAGLTGAALTVWVNGVSVATGAVTGSMSDFDVAQEFFFRKFEITSVQFDTPDLSWVDAIMEFDEVLSSTEMLRIYNKRLGLKLQENE